MADLISVAFDNARLFTESQEALALSRRTYGESSGQAWIEQARSILGYSSSDLGTFPFKDINTSEAQIDQTRPEDVVPLSIPLKIRDTVIGELQTYKADGSDEWKPEELSMIEMIVDELAVALEGARLYQETQQRVGLEQVTREVSTRMRESLDIETVIQTAASELRKVLDLSEVEIRMGTTQEE